MAQVRCWVSGISENIESILSGVIKGSSFN